MSGSCYTGTTGNMHFHIRTFAGSLLRQLTTAVVVDHQGHALLGVTAGLVHHLEL